MKVVKQFNISLIIRGMIIPVILIATLLGGIRLNQKIVSLIDFGFTSKLATLASTAGAFVRMDDHEILIQPRSMTTIRRGFDDSWLTLSSTGSIHTLILDGSVSLEPTFSFLQDAEFIVSFAVLEQHLFTLHVDGHLKKWTRDGELIRQIRVNASETSILAASTVDKSLILKSDDESDVTEFDANLNRIGLIEIPIHTLLDVNFTSSGQLVLLTSDQQVVTINQTTNTPSHSVDITCPDPGPCMRIESIAFTTQDSIWAISQALTLLSPDGMIDPNFYAHPNYYDHISERYLRYVVPMREIREKQELTYLYTFILNNEDKTLSYIMDSRVDENFTHIGYVDTEVELEDFIAATDVLLTTKPYVSKIKPWGQWGLVKIGFAPIYNSNGSGSAIMGADQNVSSIDQVSREALVILALSSFVFLLFGASASWFIAKTLTYPLLELKDNVLSIAAGFLDKQIALPRLRDLQPLSEVFKEAGNNLKNEVVHGPQILQKFEQLRLQQDYQAYMELKIRDKSRLPFNLKLTLDYQKRVGWYSNGQNMFLWILKSDHPSHTNLLNTHNMVFQTFCGLFENHSDSPNMLDQIHGMHAHLIGALIEYRSTDQLFRVLLSDPFSFVSDHNTKEHSMDNELHTSYLQILVDDKSEVLSITERNTL